MAKRRIKKPVRKKKSDYPGEMSFRKALGMNPTYYQDGGDYNMQRALELGYTPDEAGHYPSADGETGMWLKSKQHPTAWKEAMYGYQLNPEVYNNYNVTYNPEGYFGENQLQYVPKKFGGKLYYQEDTGDLPTTKYGTPEYEEAYRTGNLLVNGVRPLPEFKVTPEYKSLSDELRRAAILGTKGAAELTGVPGAVRFVKSPVQSLKGAGNTIVDLGMTIGPLAAMNPMGGVQYATQGINPLTGEGSFRAEDVEGAFNTLDAAGIATLAGAGLKTPVQAAIKTPLQQGLRQTGKYLTQGPLKNAYNVLPEGAFSGYSKLRNPNKSYRVAGMDAYDDFVESGLLRSKTPQPQPGMSFAQKMQQRPTAFPSFQKGYADLNYLPEEGGVIFETSLPTFKRGQINPVTGQPIKGRHYAHRVIDPQTGATMGSIPGENISVYGSQPHWLKGYPQINTPKQLPGSPNAFKSEIDWAKWNVDTPNYPELINEYNAIEESTKKAGTWMKNPDGSAFQGTPEQFIQQQSSHFKKAFPNVLRDEAGNIQKTYHGSQNTFDFFDPNIMMTGRTRGEGIYTSPFKERAASYATKGDKKIYELYQNANKQQDIVEQFYKASDQRFKNFLEKNPKGSKDFDKKFDEFMKKEDELYSLTDEDFNLQQNYDFFKASPDEYVVPFTNYPKSTIGNVGFFDMTNPNMYKSLAPFIGTGLGIYGANQMQDAQPTMQRFGGKLRYARGGSLTSAQDTAQAADLNKDVMRKDIKKATFAEDFGAAAYGVFEGTLDTLTFGLTDELTDAGFKGLQAAAGHDVNSDEAKRQAGIKGWGNVGGAVVGGFVNPGAIGSAVEEGLEGVGTGIEGIDPSSDIATGIGTSLKGMAGSKVLGGLNDKDKIPEGMQGFSKLFMARNGGRFRYGYRGGGHMLNQNMGLTEIDGPSHEDGGVTLPNSGGRPDVEVEGPETIYTPENYVMSEKMKASKEALEYAGITGKAARRLAGKSYADLSKAIKSKAGDKLRPADPLSKKMLDKEMKRLMMAHEYDREAKRMKDEAMRSQMMGGSNIIAETPEERAGGYNMYPNAESIAFPGSGPTSVVPTYNNDPIMVTGADGSQQMLTDEPIETEAPFIEQKMAQGGKMIKRADGSYSRRGLWDNIRANRGSGRKPTKQMLEQEAKIKAAEKAYGGYYADGGKMPTEVLRSRLESHMSPQEADNYLEQYADGGSFDNPGFRALPDYVQAKIKSNMALGGFMGDYIDEDDTMEYGSGGYTVRRTNDRKGKTHVVTGPDGTKKYFGDPNLGERGKSKYGKDAFYARHKKNLAKNPYFRAYARATWEDGGYMNMLDSNVDMVDMETPMYEYGGSMMYGQGGGIHIDPSKRGTFKAQASRMGMGVQQAARTILNAPEGKYSPAMRKKANFARNFAKADGGYMYQMGGEMMAQQPQGGGQEEIMQQVAQMLQQGMAPEEIVGQLVKMGLPQEQAIQIVQMIVQQMQGQQQAPQEAPQQAPPMMRGGGYMYQMGGEMAPQQAPQQGGSQEQIMQAIVEMLQQGLQPEQIVGELVKMGIPQEAAIQAVQMVMQQVQQSQGMQQQQAAPPAEQGMMGQQQAAPATMRGGGRMYQMGGSLADNYLAQVNQYPVLKRGGGKLYYQQDIGLLPDEGLIPTFETQNSTKEPVPPYVKPTGIYPYTPPSNLPDNPLTQTALRNFYRPQMPTVEVQQQSTVPISRPLNLPTPAIPQMSASMVKKAEVNNTPPPPLDPYESPMGNYIAGGVGSMLGPLANAAAAAFAPDPTYTAAPKLGRYDYTPVALQRAQANQAMANTRQAIRMGAPTQGSYLANVGVALPSAGANYGSQIAQTSYGIGAQNIALANEEAKLRAKQAGDNALMKDQSISNKWKLGMEAAAGTGRNIQGFSKDLAAKRMQDMLVNQLRTGDFSAIGYDLVDGKLYPKLAPTGLATYNDGTIILSNGQKARRIPGTDKYELIPQS